MIMARKHVFKQGVCPSEDSGILANLGSLGSL